MHTSQSDNGSSLIRAGRRKFLAAAGALLAVPSLADGQGAGRPPVVGFVSPVAPGPRDAAFLQGLKELGYSEGRNIRVELRFADARPERLPELIGELVRLKVDVLVVGATIGAREAMKATTTIPIVFAGSSDPIAGGIVTNLARPGGNITGFSLAIGDGFAGKWLELLREATPGVSHFAALWSSSNAAAAGYLKELEAVARISNLKLDAHQAANPSELDGALAAIGRSAARGLIVMSSPFASSQQDRLIRFAADQRLPAIYFAEEFVDAGGLMSYGPSYRETYRRAATYVDRILKGAKPGELPVQQPTAFELVVNLRTAKALGIVMPLHIRQRADRVIE
jgi:putative ABC transport system substrate-binding protein